jgi:hypothetical protein
MCTLYTTAQDIESTLDIITLAEVDGVYTVSKTNSDTTYTIVLDSSIVIKEVLEQYRAELATPDGDVDIYTPFAYVIAPIYPLAEQVLVYRKGDFADFVIEALSPKQTLGHESWKQHDYLVKTHSFYYGTSIPSHTASVDRAIQGDGTAIVVQSADSVEHPTVILARDIRDNFGGAIVDLAEPEVARNTANGARIIHFGPVATLKDDGIWLKRRVDIQAEFVTYLSLSPVNEVGVDHLLKRSIKSILVANGAKKIKANQRMINKYYKQLFDGDRKHDALATAIRDYIRNVSGVTNAHPYYWTSIRQYGDIKSVDGNVPSRLYWILILVMIALFVMLRKSGGRLY